MMAISTLATSASASATTRCLCSSIDPPQACRKTRMFQVITINLSTDTTTADVAHGAVDIGELTAEEFAALLERFRRLDAVQNHEAEPHLFVTAPAGKFRIRTGQGKLFLDNARDSSEPYADLAAEEIVRQLERSTPPAATFDETGAATGKSA